MGMPPMLGDESPGIISIDIGRPRSIDIGRASDTCSAASCTGWLPASGMLTVTPWREVADRLWLLEPESGGVGEPSFDAAPPPSFPNRCCSFANSRCRSWLTSSSPCEAIVPPAAWQMWPFLGWPQMPHLYFERPVELLSPILAIAHTRPAPGRSRAAGARPRPRPRSRVE